MITAEIAPKNRLPVKHLVSVKVDLKAVIPAKQSKQVAKITNRAIMVTDQIADLARVSYLLFLTIFQTMVILIRTKVVPAIKATARYVMAMLEATASKTSNFSKAIENKTASVKERLK